MIRNSKPILTVSQLNEYIKALIDRDQLISGVYIRGEISGINFNSSGHIYMKLKDESSSVPAAMFRYNAQKLKFAPKNGMKVIALGRVSVYTPGGYYSLNIDSLVPEGAGELALRFEQLKSKLEAEGLFDQSHKKALPAFPSTVGIITSPTGAAVWDIINICTRRYPAAKLLLFPVQVQGEGSAESMIDALGFFAQKRCADVLIIGRGGGSTEDLWEFNDERLARAIYACPIPVISAVGHETDFTICDFVADRRAPTPSGAAELAVPDGESLLSKLDAYKSRLDSLLLGALDTRKRHFTALAESYIFSQPLRMFENKYITLDKISEKLDISLKLSLERKKAGFTATVSKLEALSPLAVLTRGYAAVYSEDDKVISSVKETAPGRSVTLEMSDGYMKAAVTAISERKKKSGKQQ